MTELDKKEKITRSKCLFDIKYGSETRWGVALFYAVLMIVLVVAEVYVLTQGLDLEILATTVISVVLGILIILILVSTIKSVIKAKKRDFLIIEDYVTETDSYISRRNYRKLCYITFNRSGTYELPHENYIWSDYSKAYAEDVFNATQVGDKFYVAARKSDDRAGTWVALAVYNQRYFELSEKSFEPYGEGWRIIEKDK